MGRDRGYLVPFRARHGGRSVALGFSVMEERTRLRADYAGRKIEVPGGQSVYVRLRETDQTEEITVE